MVRSLADRTFQLSEELAESRVGGREDCGGAQGEQEDGARAPLDEHDSGE